MKPFALPGMNEREARVEIACRWFDGGKRSFDHAAASAHLAEVEFEAQLEQPGLPHYRCNADRIEKDVETLKQLGRGSCRQ